MLIITIALFQIEAGNSNSQPNNKKYGEASLGGITRNVTP
jgi:hypothetical protein